ncbi:MAG TPA: hypothetical protein VGY66_23555 [Gemmataceae bacterium]|jgi:hypothetical protein|nr:hypothetical protein [Gemmataceae bacterium]
MDNSGNMLRVLRKIAFFALVGFAVIFLTGPVVAMLSFIISAGLFVLFFLLPFALLGLMVWLPIRLIFGKGRNARRDLWRTGRFVGRAAVVMPARACGHVYTRTLGLGERLHQLTCFIGTIFVETISGALVGALLGAIAGFQTQAWHIAIPAGAVIGTGLGVIVGASRIRRPTETLSRPVSETG